MDLVRPWLVALILGIGLQFVYGFFLVDIATVSELQQPSTRLLYLALPSLFINLPAAAAAALVHRAPERDRPGRNAVAALGLLVLLCGVTVAQSVGAASVTFLVASTGAQLLGAVLGWLLVLLVRQLRVPEERRFGYQ